MAEIEILEKNILYVRSDDSKRELLKLREWLEDYSDKEDGASLLVSGRIQAALNSVNEYYLTKDLRAYGMPSEEVHNWLSSLFKPPTEVPPVQQWRELIMSDDKTAAIMAYHTTKACTTTAIPALLERLPTENRLDVCANIIKGLNANLHSPPARSRILEQVPNGTQLIADIPPIDNNLFDFRAWQEFTNKYKSGINKVHF